MELIKNVTEDIQSDSDKRILALLPVSKIGNPEIEVAVAYAFQPEGQPERYFTVKAVNHGLGSGGTVLWDYAWGRQEFTTARQAVEACLYANGFGGKTPQPIKVD